MAITKQGYVLQALNNGLKLQLNEWVGAGAAANLTTKRLGQGISSIAYNSSTGKYLITFSEVGYQTPAFFASVTDSADNKWNVKLGAYAPASKMLVVWCYADTTLTDLPTTATLSILALHCDSTVPQ